MVVQFSHAQARTTQISLHFVSQWTERNWFGAVPSARMLHFTNSLHFNVEASTSIRFFLFEKIFRSATFDQLMWKSRKLDLLSISRMKERGTKRDYPKSYRTVCWIWQLEQKLKVFFSLRNQSKNTFRFLLLLLLWDLNFFLLLSSHWSNNTNDNDDDKNAKYSSCLKQEAKNEERTGEKKVKCPFFTCLVFLVSSEAWAKGKVYK